MFSGIPIFDGWLCRGGGLDDERFVSSFLHYPVDFRDFQMPLC